MIELWVGKKIPREKSGILGLFIFRNVSRHFKNLKGECDYETDNNTIEKYHQRRSNKGR